MSVAAAAAFGAFERARVLIERAFVLDIDAAAAFRSA